MIKTTKVSLPADSDLKMKKDSITDVTTAGYIKDYNIHVPSVLWNSGHNMQAQ